MKPLAPVLPASHKGFCDSHCHMDPDVFGDDQGVDDAVWRALDAGVTRLISIGSGATPQAIANATRASSRHASVWATAGVHPHDASAWSPAMADALRELASGPRLVAFGEMGLDYHYDLSPRDAQRAAFRAQIRLALDLAMPIVIHDRESGGETQAILEEEGAYAGAGVLYHCFTGTVPEMSRIVALGGYISVPGIVTFKSAGQMRQVAASVPVDRLLIETDSPYLTPVPYRGSRNEPALVPWVAAAVAHERKMALEDLALYTWENAGTFFRLPVV